MIYASANDMIARYPSRDLVQITNEDPTATAINQTALIQALSDASAEIDGYLSSRFRLPLTEPPAVLNRLACDIAMYRLQGLRPLHEIVEARKRYDDAVAILTQVARGEVTLGLAIDNTEPGEGMGAVVTQAGGDATGMLPARLFDRGSLKGY